MNIASLDTVLDKYVDKLFFWAIPRSVRPNYFTMFRIASTPVIFILLSFGYLKTGFGLFIISMLTDLIDGALARARNQITKLGKVLDPIADKLLILVTLLYIGFAQPIVMYFSVFIVIEIVGVIVGMLMTKYLGPVKHEGANTYGKIKMWLQCIGIILYLIGVFSRISLLLNFSVGLLIAGLCFALLSAYEQSRIRLEQVLTFRRTKAARV